MSFIKISFFKSPKLRTFNYNPRYWDPEKEKLEERKKAIAREMGVPVPEEAIDPDTPYRPNIKGQMKRYMKAGKRKSIWAKGSRLYVLLVLMLLIIAAYFSANLFGLMFTKSSTPQAVEQKQEEPKEPRNEDTHFIIPLP